MYHFFKIYLQYIYWTLFFIARCSNIFASELPEFPSLHKPFCNACKAASLGQTILYQTWANNLYLYLPTFKSTYLTIYPKTGFKKKHTYNVNKKEYSSRHPIFEC